MTDEQQSPSWHQDQRFVLEELKRMNSTVSNLTNKIDEVSKQIAQASTQGPEIASLRNVVYEHKSQIAVLKMQCALYGACASIVVSGAISIAVAFIK